MPITLSQRYVETKGRKFRHQAVGCSKDFTELLKTFFFENLPRMSFGFFSGRGLSSPCSLFMR